MNVNGFLKLQKSILVTLIVVATGYIVRTLVNKPVSINLDGAMYLDGAKTLLQGGLPYLDFVDINPPLAIYLHALPTLLSQLTGLHVFAGFLALLICATLLSAVSSYRLLRQTDAEASVMYAVIIALVPAARLLICIPDRELGQRSHLFMLALLPYLSLRTARHNGVVPAQLPAILIGLAMAAALCLKPLHYTVILLPAELYLLLRHRHFRMLVTTETVTIVIAVLVYGLHFFFLPEASTEAFFNTYLPLIAQSYGAYEMPWPELMYKAAEYLAEPLIIATGCAVLLPAKSPARIRDLSIASCLIAWSAAAIFILQAKGWSYHAMPVWFSAMIAAACLIAALLNQVKQNRFQPTLTSHPVLLIVAVSLIMVAVMTDNARNNAKQYLKSDQPKTILELSTDNDRIFVMSTSVDASYPIIQLTGRQQATRYPFLFPIPMLYDDASQIDAAGMLFKINPQRLATERAFLDNLNTDLKQDQPALILVGNFTPCPFCRGQMRLPRYLKRNSKSLPELQNYVMTGKIRRFDIWERQEQTAQ
jgi:hypothetical protein